MKRWQYQYPDELGYNFKPERRRSRHRDDALSPEEIQFRRAVDRCLSDARNQVQRILKGEAVDLAILEAAAAFKVWLWDQRKRLERFTKEKCEEMLIKLRERHKKNPNWQSPEWIKAIGVAILKIILNEQDRMLTLIRNLDRLTAEQLNRHVIVG